MKHLYLITLLLFMIMVGSCKDTTEEPIKPSFYKGETTMMINLDSVTYCVYGTIGKVNGNNGIYVISDLITGYIQTRSFAIFIPGDTGVFLLHEDVDFESRYARAKFYFKDADVILASYHIPEEKANGIVSILSYDKESGEISGDFECVLYLKQNYGLSNPPDSLVIKNGHFETIVVE